MSSEENDVNALLMRAVEAALGPGSRGLSDAGGATVTPIPGNASAGTTADTASEAGKTVEATALSTLTSALSGATPMGSGWSSLISAVNPLAGLFAGLSGGSSEAAAAPVLPKLRLEGANYEAGFAGTANPAIVATERAAGGQYGSVAEAASAQVVIQVQAMDSKSFLDHTPEIAEAVKRALLESSSIRDVLNEY